MTTFGDEIRTDVTSVFGDLGIPMTLETGTYTDFDVRAGRAVGTTSTDYSVTGFLIEAETGNTSEGSEGSQRETSMAYLDAAQLATLGATLKRGQVLIVGSERWRINGFKAVRPDASAALWMLEVSRP